MEFLANLSMNVLSRIGFSTRKSLYNKPSHFQVETSEDAPSTYCHILSLPPELLHRIFTHLEDSEPITNLRLSCTSCSRAYLVRRFLHSSPTHESYLSGLIEIGNTIHTLTVIFSGSQLAAIGLEYLADEVRVVYKLDKFESLTKIVAKPVSRSCATQTIDHISALGVRTSKQMGRRGQRMGNIS